MNAASMSSQLAEPNLLQLPEELIDGILKVLLANLRLVPKVNSFCASPQTLSTKSPHILAILLVNKQLSRQARAIIEDTAVLVASMEDVDKFTSFYRQPLGFKHLELLVPYHAKWEKAPRFFRQLPNLETVAVDHLLHHIEVMTDAEKNYIHEKPVVFVQQHLLLDTAEPEWFVDFFQPKTWLQGILSGGRNALPKLSIRLMDAMDWMPSQGNNQKKVAIRHIVTLFVFEKVLRLRRATRSSGNVRDRDDQEGAMDEECLELSNVDWNGFWKEDWLKTS